MTERGPSVDERLARLEQVTEQTRVAVRRATWLLRERHLLSAEEVAAVWEEVSEPGEELAAFPSDVVPEAAPRARRPRRSKPAPAVEQAEPAKRTDHAQIGRLGARVRWAQEEDRSAATQPARDGLQRRFEREVDPDGVLAPDERARRVESARRAYFQRMAHASAKARRRKGGDAAG